MWRWFKALVLGLWRGIKGFNRVVVTLVPLVIIIYVGAIIALAIQEVQPEPIPESTALLVAPSGMIVENRSQREPVDALLQANEGETVILPII